MSESLDTKIKEYAKLHKQSASLKKRLDASKEYFKKESGGEAATFEATDGTRVVVTPGQSTNWDSVKLEKKLGGHVDKFKKTTDYLKVSGPQKPATEKIAS